MKRTPVRAVAAMFLLAGIVFGGWATRVPTIKAKYGLSEAQLGLVLLLVAGGGILAFAQAGRAGDIFGAGRASRAFAIAALLFMFLFSLAPTVWVLVPLLLLFGAGMGGMDVVMNSWATEIEEARGKAIMARMHGLFSFGGAIGAGFAALCFSLGIGITLHYILVIILFGLPALWFAQIPWESPETDATEAAPLFALPRGALLPVALIALLATFGEGSTADWSALYIIEQPLGNEQLGAIGFTLFSASMMTMRFLGDSLIDRFGRVTMVRFCGAVSGVSGLIVTFAPNAYVALLGFFLMGFGFALAFPIAMSRAAEQSPRTRGRAIASVATLGYGGMLVAPPLIGFIAERSSLQMGFALIAFMAFLLIALAPSLRRAAPERVVTGG
ncbi:MFS transporter [Paracoccaceae bacterium GXU_MW_L88]